MATVTWLVELIARKQNTYTSIAHAMSSPVAGLSYGTAGRMRTGNSSA
jgi:hypothetical protein